MEEKKNVPLELDVHLALYGLRKEESPTLVCIKEETLTLCLTLQFLAKHGNAVTKAMYEAHIPIYYYQPTYNDCQ